MNIFAGSICVYAAIAERDLSKYIPGRPGPARGDGPHKVVPFSSPLDDDYYDEVKNKEGVDKSQSSRLQRSPQRFFGRFTKPFGRPSVGQFRPFPRPPKPETLPGRFGPDGVFQRPQILPAPIQFNG